jgi:hypothetical protein
MSICYHSLKESDKSCTPPGHMTGAAASAVDSLSGKQGAAWTSGHQSVELARLPVTCIKGLDS